MHYQRMKESKKGNTVAQEVAAMVDDEPGPAGDFVKCYVTTCEKKKKLTEII